MDHWGDWNCTREELMQIGWLKLVKGVIVAPKVNTRNSRVIDLFVVSDGLRQAAPAAYTVGDGGFYPTRRSGCSSAAEPGRLL